MGTDIIPVKNSSLVPSRRRTQTLEKLKPSNKEILRYSSFKRNEYNNWSEETVNKDSEQNVREDDNPEIIDAVFWKKTPEITNVKINKKNIGKIQELIEDANQGKNNIVRLVLGNDLADEITINNLRVPEGTKIRITGEGAQEREVTLSDCNIAGVIETDANIKLNIIGKDPNKKEGEDEENSPKPGKKIPYTSKIVGVVRNVFHYKNVNVVNGVTYGGANDLVADLYNLPLINKKTILKYYDGMIFNQNTKFYPSLEKCFQQFLKEGNDLGDLEEKDLKIITSILKIGSLKINELKNLKNNISLLQEVKESVAKNLGIDIKDVEETIEKIDKNYDKIKEFNHFANEYREKINKKIHKILNKYSHKVKTDPNMSFEELRKYLENEDTYANITKVDNLKYFNDKKIIKESVYEIFDRSTEREFVIAMKKNGKLAVFLKTPSRSNDETLKKGQMFIFEQPSEFLQRMIIDDEGMEGENWGIKSIDSE